MRNEENGKMTKAKEITRGSMNEYQHSRQAESGRQNEERGRIKEQRWVPRETKKRKTWNEDTSENASPCHAGS